MTDDDLSDIEVLWKQEPSGMPDLLRDAVPELVAEVRRLRALIKRAEVLGCTEHRKRRREMKPTPREKKAREAAIVEAIRVVMPLVEREWCGNAVLRALMALKDET